MKSWLSAYTIGIVVFGVSVAIGQGLQSRRPGMEQYTPTKLEWLAVELNAANSIEVGNFGAPSGFIDINYFARHQDDAILILVQYTSNTRREDINDWTQIAREAVQTAAKNHGWDWVKTREETKQHQPR
jgi:hypothetical protein